MFSYANVYFSASLLHSIINKLQKIHNIPSTITFTMKGSVSIETYKTKEEDDCSSKTEIARNGKKGHKHCPVESYDSTVVSSNTTGGQASTKQSTCEDPGESSLAGRGGKVYRDKKTARRMETNRIRAREIRKRKKQLEADMQQQIIKLTLENNQLRTKIKIQQSAVKLLRTETLGFMTNVRT